MSGKLGVTTRYEPKNVKPIQNCTVENKQKWGFHSQSQNKNGSEVAIIFYKQKAEISTSSKALLFLSPGWLLWLPSFS